MTAMGNRPVLVGRDLHKSFRRSTGEVVQALNGVSLEVSAGKLTALVGPDGAGKTTLLRLVAGLLFSDSGTLEVLGLTVAKAPQEIQARIGYMPQKFGLYDDLTAQENLDLYADLHGVPHAERTERFARLLEMTALGPFTDRLAGRLSGGMKQKLGLACTLIRAPELLLLDEPTVGVDPLSRRELWDIILGLVRTQGLTVLLSTSYLDEAQRCNHVAVLHQGNVLAHGAPDEVTALAMGRTFLVDPSAQYKARVLQAQLLDDPCVVDAVPEGGHVRVVRALGECRLRVEEGAAGEGAPSLVLAPTPARFEDGFMVLLRQRTQAHPPHRTPARARPAAPPAPAGQATVVEVHDLVRQFGTFPAVDHVSFQVRRGEIFGLLGPNGAGKTTTFRMLCGLLPPTSGTLRVAGVDVGAAAASARQRLGYVAQKFALYGQLSVTENLEFFSRAYGLRESQARMRIDWALREFELTDVARLPAEQLAGGYRQRLAMAAALLHEPEILFLDEPTSGADPLARRDFWRRITDLAENGVTIVVTTHFMEEAEYCDRVVILDAGQVLAQGTPAEIRSQAPPESALGHEPTMEDAFIAIVEKRRGQTRPASPNGPAPTTAEPASPAHAEPTRPVFPAAWGRVAALVRKEARQIVRDPSSIAIGIVLPLLLILLFGYALSLDVLNVPVAIALEDPGPEATELAAGFQLSPYFAARLLTSMAEAEQLMLERKVDGIVRIRPDFARRLALGDADVQVLVHGTDANRARIIQAYAQGAVGQWTVRRLAEGKTVPAGPVGLRDRLWFNEANESRHFLVPGLIVLIMTLIGALLTALVMAREWERGTLEALFVTPVRAGEILLGKTIPYFALGMIGFVLCLLAADFLFHVPLRGSLLVLTGVSMLYLLVALAIGLLISTAFKSQFMASQVTLLVTFMPALMLSGFLFDLTSMPAGARMITYIVPARYFVAVLQTLFLAGDVWAVIVPNAAMLAAMAFALLTLTRVVTRKRLE